MARTANIETKINIREPGMLKMTRILPINKYDETPPRQEFDFVAVRADLIRKIEPDKYGITFKFNPRAEDLTDDGYAKLRYHHVYWYSEDVKDCLKVTTDEGEFMIQGNFNDLLTEIAKATHNE